MNEQAIRASQARRLLLLAVLAGAALPSHAAISGSPAQFSEPDAFACDDPAQAIFRLGCPSFHAALGVPRGRFQIDRISPWPGFRAESHEALPPEGAERRLEEARLLLRAEGKAFLADDSDLIILDVPGRAPPNSFPI